MAVKIKKGALNIVKNGVAMPTDVLMTGDGGVDPSALSELSKKADRIVVNMETEKDTIRNSSEKPLVDLKVLGQSKQVRRFGYNLMYFDEAEWKLQDEANVEYNFAGNDALTITAKNTKTAQFQAWTNPITYRVDEIAGKTVKIKCDYSYSTTSPNVNWGIFFDVKSATGTTLQSPGYAFGRNSTHFETTFRLHDNAYSYIVVFRVWNVSDSNRFEIGDTVSVTNARMTLDETIKPFEIVSADTPDIVFGSTHSEMPYVLRGIGDVHDEVDMLAGTMTRRIDPNIDSEVETEKTDFTEYILETPIVEPLSSAVKASLRTLKTDMETTDVDGDGALLRFAYVADTKLYVDGSTAMDFSTPEQFGAVGDGVSNDTDAFLRACNEGAGVVQLGNDKTYLVDLLQLDDVDTLEINGNGSTLLLNTHGMSGTGAENGTVGLTVGTNTPKKSFTMRNIAVDVNARSIAVGDTIGGNVLQGVDIFGYESVLLDGVSITDTLTGTGLRITDAKTTTITNCHFHHLGHLEYPQIQFPNYNFGGMHIACTSEEVYIGSRALIEGCVFEEIAASCVTAEPQFVTIRDCYIADNHSQFVESGAGKVFIKDKVYEVSNNTFVRQGNVLFSSSTQTTERMEDKGNTAIFKNNTVLEIGGGTNLRQSHGDTAVCFAIVINDNALRQCRYDKVIVEGNVFQYTDNEKDRMNGLLVFANKERIIRNNTFVNWRYIGIHGGTLYDDGRSYVSGNIMNECADGAEKLISVQGFGALYDISNNIARYLVDDPYYYTPECRFYVRNNVTDKYFVNAHYKNTVEVNNLPYSFEDA